MHQVRAWIGKRWSNLQVTENDYAKAAGKAAEEDGQTIHKETPADVENAGFQKRSSKRHNMAE